MHIAHIDGQNITNIERIQKNSEGAMTIHYYRNETAHTLPLKEANEKGNQNLSYVRLISPMS